MNNRQFRISGIYFVFLLVLVYLFSTYVKRMDMENLYTYQQFETAVENGEVVSAVISQSEATPTGTVRLSLSDFNTPAQIEKLAQELHQLFRETVR